MTRLVVSKLGLSKSVIVLAAVSSLILGAGLLTLVEVAYATFVEEPKAPEPLAAPAEKEVSRRLAIPLLDQLPRARVSLPSLEEAAALLQGTTRGIPLPTIDGLRGKLRKAVVAVALGLDPGHSDEVDHEVRHALFLPSPGQVSWSLTLPSRARLDFSVACHAGKRPDARAARLAISVRNPEGGEIRREIDVEPGSPAGGAAWKQQSLDLASFSGQPVSVELRSEAIGGGKGVALLLVGNPRILGDVDAGGARGPNVLFINIDTTRAASTGIGGDAHRPTPNIDQLAAEGAFFSRAYANANWTRPSNLAFLTGRYPSQHGLKNVMIPTLPEERRSYYLSGIVALPLHLDRHGYLTAAIVQNNLLEDIWGTGVDVGFAEYDYVRETLDHSLKITRKAMSFIEEHRDQTWFLYLSYNAPHWPYRPFREALVRCGMALDSPLNWFQSLYRGEVNLTDHYLGPLLATLDAVGLRENTLVVLNSDHGEQLDRRHAQEIIRESNWEVDSFPHVKTKPGHDGISDEVIRVPLVMRWPGHIPSGRRIDLAVGLRDLPATLLDLIDLPPLPGPTGRSLVPSLRGQAQVDEPILIEGKSIYALVAWPYKYIRRDGLFQWMRYDRLGEPMRPVPEEIYDLEADPQESSDLSRRRQDLLPRFRDTLAALRPPPRFVYFFSARSAPLQGEAGFEIRLEPSSSVDQIHLLDDDGPADDDDAVSRSGDATTVTLRLARGDVDRIAFTTSTAAASLKMTLVRQAGDGSASLGLSGPVRAGAMRLPMDERSLGFSDGDRSPYLDADADPDTSGPGLYFWRIPLVGGIQGRGGKIEEAVQQAFHSWGYVK
jgi:arylsulfatase